MSHVIAFFSGLLFAVGLAVSGMTQPAKVVGFLDLFGSWDPSLMMVMIGAIGVYMPLYRLITRQRSPLLAVRFALPTRRDIDTRLVLGSALFGAGWGLAGYCPGPALTSLATLGSAPIAFVLAMMAGMLLHYALEYLRERRRAARDQVAPGRPSDAGARA